MNLCHREPIQATTHDPLAAIVQTYLDRNAAEEDRYLQYYRIQRTLAAAVEKAALAELPGGKRFSHQHLIPKSVLRAAADALLKTNFNSIPSFEELFSLVERTIGPISGIGELAVYDTAHRIGAYLGLMPEHIYLHAGVRSGAKALGLNYRAKKLPMSALPKQFYRLLPEQAEDCLCIYKEALKRAKDRYGNL